ncbi:MAG: hypothetical protein GY757_53735 [bacterium]|nr:hypothetical protein [bacterium]
MKHYLEITPIKGLLYDILNAGTQDDGDVSVKQRMDVALSSAVRKDGVNMIQFQNVVTNKIVLKVTEALQILDRAMLDAPTLEAATMTITAPDLPETEEEVKEIAPENDLDLIMDQHLQGDVRLDEFLALMSGRYVAQALEHFNNKKGVAQTHLGISNVRLNRIMQRCGIEWQR